MRSSLVCPSITKLTYSIASAVCVALTSMITGDWVNPPIISTPSSREYQGPMLKGSTELVLVVDGLKANLS